MPLNLQSCPFHTESSLVDFVVTADRKQLDAESQHKAGVCGCIDYQGVVIRIGTPSDAEI